MAQAIKLPFLNTVTLAGRLVADPHPLQAKGDREGSAFTIASNKYQKGKKPITTYVDIVAWGSVAEAVNANLKSGDAVLVSGSLANYEKKGNGSSGPTKVLQVSAASVQFLTRRDNGDEPSVAE